MIKIFRNQAIFNIQEESSDLYQKVFEVSDEVKDGFCYRLKISVESHKNPIVIAFYEDKHLVGAIFAFDFLSENWWAQQVGAYLPQGIDGYPHTCELNELFVDKDYQGQGIGSLLLEGLHQETRW